MQYEQVVLSNVVMHSIVRKLPGWAPEPQSEAEAPLTPQQMAYIQDRIRGVLAAHARPVSEAPGLSGVPDALRECFAGRLSVVELSQNAATALQDAQPSIAPQGIFVVAKAMVGKTPALLFAKLEHENGVRAKASTLPDGRRTFDVQFLNDLLFTTGSRIFKVAVFGEVGVGDGVTGVVVDQQANGTNVAEYFISKFLGCQLTERADLLTERFHKGTQSWINNLKDGEKQARYEVALISELQNNRRTLSVDVFATTHLDREDRDHYVNGMRGSVPLRTFEKDVRLVKSQLKRIRFDFVKGITLLTPPEAIEGGSVSVQNNEDDTSTLIIRDVLDKTSSHGRFTTSPAGVDD